MCVCVLMYRDLPSTGFLLSVPLLHPNISMHKAPYGRKIYQFHLCSTPSAIYQVHFVPVCLLFCVGARVGHCRPVPTIDQWSMSLLSSLSRTQRKNHAALAVDRLQHGQAHRLHLLTPKDCFIGVFRARFQHPGIGSGVWTLRWRGP